MITCELLQDALAPAEQISDPDLQRLSTIINQRFGSEFDGVVNIAFITDEEIRRLNRQYRAKDSITDVLSFTYDLDAKGEELGEVVISYEQAKRQAEEGFFRNEIFDLIIHGILHVIGYDHEAAADAEIMFPLQDELVGQML